MNIIVHNVTSHCHCQDWGVKVLKRVLKSRGLDTKGSKQDLQGRLIDYVDKSWQRPSRDHEKKAANASVDNPSPCTCNGTAL